MPTPAVLPVEALLFALVRIATFDGDTSLTSATGFFFERDDRLYLVTSRHVFADPTTCHFPDRIEITLHADTVDLTAHATMSMLLYQNGRSCWRQGSDSGGDVDIAVLEVDRAQWPAGTSAAAFNPSHLQPPGSRVEMGAALLIAGYPLGFHDALHALPVARQAAVASAYGIRFQGKGFFLTDARMHRGTSGSPVLMRAPSAPAGEPLPWRLLGVHSSRMDIQPRDPVEDEALGLNCAWYADMLLTLTAAEADAPTAPASAGSAAPASPAPPASTS